MGHPKRQEPQNAASLLEPRQLLPFALKHRQQRRMERVAGCELFFRVICGEPIGNLGSVVENEFAILLRGLLALVGNTSSLEQTASDNLRSLRFSRHNHRLAETIKKFLKTVKVPFIFGRHLI